jgi:hypothetical protein
MDNSVSVCRLENCLSELAGWGPSRNHFHDEINIISPEKEKSPDIRDECSGFDLIPATT